MKQTEILYPDIDTLTKGQLRETTLIAFIESTIGLYTELLQYNPQLHKLLKKSKVVPVIK
jgi:hypothetical protein